MTGYHYVGLDVHKKMIAYCIKTDDGTLVDEGTVRATRRDLDRWSQNLPHPWMAAMEATLFTDWVYDFLKPRADEIKVGHSFMLKAICASKKKNDRLDARKICDALRLDWFPESYMAPAEVRELRRVLRYRNLLVREAVRMKNKTAGLLLESGAEYDKARLHGKRYFNELLDRLDYVSPSVLELLRHSHSNMELFNSAQKRLVEGLREAPLLKERVKLLMSIAGVGEVTALTWALEVGDPARFRSVKKAVSFCGLCSAQNESAGKTRRGPLSKQRNKHLQTILVEAAKLAPRWNPQLKAVYEKAVDRGANRNQATLAVARKLVAYLLWVDRNRKEFETREP